MPHYRKLFGERFKADVGNLKMEIIISDNNSNGGTKEFLCKIMLITALEL